MENYSIILFLLALLIGLSAIAEKKKLPSSIVLIVGGIIAGFVPSMPEITIDPEVVFLIFLPPLLYDAAFNISFKDFRKNISTISSLAFGLVFLTTLGIAAVAHFLIPDMTWPVAFVLGAILSATDAVAAISITKGLGLSHKTLTILEGESLINDASALVAYRFAVAAVTGSVFVFWKAGLTFLLLLAGGAAIGLVLGRLLGSVLRWLRGYDLLINSLLLLMPFVTYLLAEELHVSGVIAVVALGLSMSRLSREKFPEPLKRQSKNIWDIIIFLLNGLIFILIGLELPFVLKNINTQHILPNLFYAFVITVVALAIRMARVFLQQRQLERGFRSPKVRGRIPEEALLDFSTSLVISWAGMRGIVSLAIALGLPTHLQDGQPFPNRHTIIFIAVAVTLFTLLGQGLLLPWLVKRVKRREVSGDH